MQRLLLIIEELKKNQYPNRNDLIKKYNRCTDYSVSTRTLARDIETLKEEFKAPIDFDYASNGYYLKNPEWDFDTPVKDTDLSIFLLGGSR